MMRRTWLLAVFLVGACGGDGSAPPEARTPLPIVAGATWSYDVLDGDTREVLRSRVYEVEALADIGDCKAGTLAYKVTRTDPEGDGYTWLSVDAEGTVYTEYEVWHPAAPGEFSEWTWFLPRQTRVDLSEDHVAAGAEWTESFMQRRVSPFVTDKDPPCMEIPEPVSQDWLVEAVDDEVTVAAGTFSALRVRRSVHFPDSEPPEVTTFWFVKCVGMVKAEGVEEIEELTSWSVPGC